MATEAGEKLVIHCLVVLCLTANPSICKAPVEVSPEDGHVITSPMECMMGGMAYFARARIEQQTPEADAPAWFPKVSARMDGDGSDIVSAWLAEQRAIEAATAPQIK